MNTYRKFKKNSKALSPVVASIILIAVTVAVSVVVAAWMGGMTIGLMGNAEQASITNVQIAAGTPGTATFTVLNSGSGSVTLTTAATIDGAPATLTKAADDSFTIEKGQTGTYTLAGTFAPGYQYDFKLTTAKGTGIVYTATCP
jgi:flagellin-like protein